MDLVPVRVVVDLVMRADGLDRDEAERRLRVPLQQLGYPPGAETLTLVDAAELLKALDSTAHRLLVRRVEDSDDAGLWSGRGDDTDPPDWTQEPTG